MSGPSEWVNAVPPAEKRRPGVVGEEERGLG